jgi:amidohydrolase
LQESGKKKDDIAMLNPTELLASARAEAGRIVAIRRDLHRHPEPGFRETRTAARIEEELARIGGWRVRRAAGTGVLCEIGPAGAPAIMLRADIDALEITEETGAEYASTAPGMMHACGHDAHTAILLGAAGLIAARQDRIGHRIRLVFQPCEETSPGGALAMIEAGALDDVEAAVGLHVYPQEEAGTIALKEGAMMAASDDFDAVFHGTGGHAAQPHEARDALLAAADFVTRLQQIVARRVDPFESMVITVGAMRAGTRRNVIADEALVEGTLRTLTPELRLLGRRLIEETAVSSATPLGARAEVKMIEVYPVTLNAPSIVAFVRELGMALLGKEKVRSLTRPSMGSEDFAYYAERVPACLFRLGSGGAEATRHPHHHPMFDIDESCLPVGAALMAAAGMAFVDSVGTGLRPIPGG